MNIFQRYLLAGLLAVAITFVFGADARAGYPYAVQPVAPAVVGYTAEQRGFFGRRVVMRPVVAPVVAAVPTVAVARPVITVARPVVAPVAPVASYYAPTVRPVAAYYAPPVTPVVTTYRVPVVTTYRLPVTSYMISY
jgi:hypothetical protein